MKTLLLTSLLLLSSISYSQKLHGVLSTGHDFESNYNFTNIELELPIKVNRVTITPFTIQKTWFETPNSILSLNLPFRQVYKLGVSVSYKKIFIKYYHHCSHVVNSSKNIKNADLYSSNITSSYTKDYAMRWLDDYNLGQTSIIEVGFKF